MKESNRIPRDFTPNSLSELFDTNQHCLNLMESNPLRCNFLYPQQQIKAALIENDMYSYEPTALGSVLARQAVATYLQKQGRTVSSSQIILTSSTSEAYAYCFKLFCEPGTGIVYPEPSYPLLDVLAQLEGVEAKPYFLSYQGYWQLDTDSLESALKTGARLVVVVQPNNPTGSIFDQRDWSTLLALCAQYQAHIIADEVFAPYIYQPETIIPWDRHQDVMIIALDGLSKAMGLPQLKLSWITLYGPHEKIEWCRTRLEWIADAYLSVSTITQSVLPKLLPLADDLQKQIRNRLLDNRKILEQSLAPIRELNLLNCQGGWYAILRVPQVMSEDAWIKHLMQEAELILHPGYFYNFPQSGYLVLGLLLPTKIFRNGIKKLVDVLNNSF